MVVPTPGNDEIVSAHVRGANESHAPSMIYRLALLCSLEMGCSLEVVS